MLVPPGRPRHQHDIRRERSHGGLSVAAYTYLLCWILNDADCYAVDQVVEYPGVSLSKVGGVERQFNNLSGVCSPVVQGGMQWSVRPSPSI